MPKFRESEYVQEYEMSERAKWEEELDIDQREYDPFLYGTEWLDVESVPYLNVKQ